MKARACFYERFHAAADPLLALALLLAGLPVWALATLAALIETKAPFFTQVRVGRHERLFQLYKLRTMRDARFPGESDSARIGLLGKLLRRTSLDEWPQLVNILRGDMAWIGPRPLLPEYLPWYTDRQRLRHSVRPGLTGLAQVRGGNALPWLDRLEADVDFVHRKNIALDLEIAIKTAFFVFRRAALRDDTTQTPERFDEWMSKQLNP